MLQLRIPARELFDESTETFFTTKEYILKLEHSLLSISKWESKYHKPFLAVDENDKRTPQEMLDYIKCMTLNTGIPSYVYGLLTPQDLMAVNDYINDPMTATRVSNKGSASREIITSEVIYYWMVAYQIPFDCEKWHINRLITLVRVCNAMNDTKSKDKKPDMIARRKLNEARLAAHKKKVK